MFLQQRVLIADSSQTLRQKLFSALLDREVFSDAVADASAAIENLATVSYGVLLLDLSLIGADAVQAHLAGLSAETRPVVLGLAHDHSATGVNDLVQIVLRRPFDVGQITDLVESCLRAVEEERKAEPSTRPPARVRRDAADL